MIGGLRIDELDKETRDKLGIELEPSLGKAGVRHIALGKVEKSIAKLAEEDALWVLQQARRSLRRQGELLLTDNSSGYVPPVGWTLQVVAQCFDVSVADMKQRSRNYKITQARQVAMYVLEMFNVYTLEQIGKELGGRTPATVSHGWQKIARRLELGRDKRLAQVIRTIKEEL